LYLPIAVELQSPQKPPEVDSKSFVACPLEIEAQVATLAYG